MASFIPSSDIPFETLHEQDSVSIGTQDTTVDVEGCRGHTNAAISSDTSAGQSEEQNRDTQVQTWRPGDRRGDYIVRNQFTNQRQTISGGFASISRRHAASAASKKTICNYIVYTVIFVAAGIVFIVIEDKFPQTHFYLVFLGLLVLFVASVVIWTIYKSFGKAKWILKRYIKDASRYLDVCQIDKEYLGQLLPKSSPHADGICHFALAGSSGDSYGFFPSQNANIGLCKRQSNIIQDVDVNLIYDALVLNNDNIMDMKKHPGYCWLKIPQSTIDQDQLIKDCLVQDEEMDWVALSGEKLSERIASYLPNDIAMNYPAMTSRNELNGPQGRFKFDIDIVFGLKVYSWPAIASEWISRERTMPETFVQEIVDMGCYVVHKHCPAPEFQRGHHQHTLDWRITFAEAESKLFQYHRTKEALKLCYIIIKFVIKWQTSVKKLSLPALKSYHLKTVYLWLAERETDLNLYDIRVNDDLPDVFELLISEYIQSLERKRLPNYFMPNMNILEPYSDEEIDKGLKFLKKIRDRPIWAVDLFDKAWLNRQRIQIIIIVLCLVVFVCFGISLYFKNLANRLNQEAQDILLGRTGDTGTADDILSSPYKYIKFSNCVSDSLSLFKVDNSNVTETEDLADMVNATFPTTTSSPPLGIQGTSKSSNRILQLIWSTIVTKCKRKASSIF